MSLKFECPHCGQRISTTFDAIGAHGTCPTCAEAFTVPTPPDGITRDVEKSSAPNPGFQGSSDQNASARNLIIRWICFSAFTLAVLVGAWVFFGNKLGRSARKAEPVVDADRARQQRITMLAVQGALASSQGKPNPVPFALVCGHVGTAVIRLKSTNPTSPEAASTRFLRFNDTLQSLPATDLPNDVTPVWSRYLAATKRLAERFRSLPPSDAELLLNALLSGGPVDRQLSTATTDEIERELLEFRNAGGSLSEAQARYRVQEIIDQINHGK